MINFLTKVFVCDNSGAKRGLCIRNLGGFNKKYSTIGEYIILAINRKDIVNFDKITKKVYLGLIVNVVKKRRRKNGFYLQFDKNKVVLLNENKELMGSSFDCLLPQEFRKQHYTKLIIFSKAII